MEDERSLAAKMTDLVRALLRERGEDSTAADGETHGTIAEIGSTQDRWKATSALLRLLRKPSRDQVVAAGEIVELALPLGPLARMRAESVRVKIGEDIVDERPAADASPFLVHVRAANPGVHEIMVQILDGRGRPLLDWGMDPRPVLHIVDGEPTVAVDAELVLRASNLDGIRELEDRKWQIVYVDAADPDRFEDIRAAVLRLGLPRGAVLVHPAASAEFRTLGVDFRAVFLTTTFRRLRSSGVPLCLVVSETEAMQVAANHCEVPWISGEHLPSRIEADDQNWRTNATAVPPGHGETFAWRLDHMTGSRALDGNHCRVEFDNRIARERLFAAVEEATHSLHLQFYMLKAGRFTEHLAARLIGAARRGVRVRLMVDGLYSADGLLGVTNAVTQGLRAEPGIDVVTIQPIRSPNMIETVVLKRRDHRKMAVIDGVIALVGGRNAADEYFTGFDEIAVTDWTPHDRIPWLDAHVEVRGPLVARVQAAFVEAWEAAGGPKIPRDPTTFPAVAADGSSRARLVIHDGLGGANAMLGYEAIIDGARNRLIIVNDFPIVASLLSAMRRAIARGVTISLLTGNAIARRGDGTFFKGPLHREAFEYMTKHRLGELLRAGAEIYEYTTPTHPLVVSRGGTIRPYVHAKVVTADGKVASIGSANLDATASYWEREANVVLEDPEVVAGVEAAVLTMMEHSHRLDPESDYWRRESRLREIAAQLWPEAVYS